MSNSRGRTTEAASIKTAQSKCRLPGGNTETCTRKIVEKDFDNSDPVRVKRIIITAFLTFHTITSSRFERASPVMGLGYLISIEQPMLKKAAS